MKQVHASVDQRFSAPDSPATPWTDAVEVLGSAEVCWITTVRADGRPHATPLVGVWAEDAMHFVTGENEQKAVNLRANPHVLISVGDPEWERGLDVTIEGSAVLVTEREQLVKLAAAWTTKWDGRWTWEIGDGCVHHEGTTDRVLTYRVEPDKAFAWSKGDRSSQTRYLFG